MRKMNVGEKNEMRREQERNTHCKMNETAITFPQANNQCGTWVLCDMDLMDYTLLSNGTLWVSIECCRVCA